jgi:hypothetical protein
VPLLFALCGKAQGRAAEWRWRPRAASLARPGSIPRSPQEVMREHLWRWLLDLPPLLGEAPLREEFVAAVGWSRRRRDELAALLPVLASWTCVPAWGRSRMRPIRTTALLPALDAQASLACWPDSMPHSAKAGLARGAAETGAYARQQGRAERPATAFAARWLARLEELHDWAAGRATVGAGGTASAAHVGAGTRPLPGRDRARPADARDRARRRPHRRLLIVAPTEWNFHPQGPLAGWLAWGATPAIARCWGNLRRARGGARSRACAGNWSGYEAWPGRPVRLKATASPTLMPSTAAESIPPA